MFDVECSVFDVFLHFVSSIFTPATTNTTASSLRIVIGAMRRLPSSFRE